MKWPSAPNGIRVATILVVWALITAVLTLTIVARYWIWSIVVASVWIYTLGYLYRFYQRNIRKVSFMFDAIDNADYAFKYATEGISTDDRVVNESLNRIRQILLQAREDAQQREKYYELIINSVDTGVLVIDDKGNIYQHNEEAMRLLGCSILTHTTQLKRIDEKLHQLIEFIKPGEKHVVSFRTERGEIHLSVKASANTIKEKKVRIVALNDIASEMDENELDSWIKITRVLTHEIMNAVTPITSLSETLLSRTEGLNDEVRNGLKVIHTTGDGLIHFVDNYRKFAHLPTPSPSLFYVKPFADHLKQLTLATSPDGTKIETSIDPQDLIIYADEGLITQVVLNLLKNAKQAIESAGMTDGKIGIKAYCETDETVVIEVTNNGPLIPKEEITHIFVPFYTTKSNGSGIGLAVSKQIMRLSGGTLTLKNDVPNGLTTFVLSFK